MAPVGARALSALRSAPWHAGRLRKLPKSSGYCRSLSCVARPGFLASPASGEVLISFLIFLPTCICLHGTNYQFENTLVECVDNAVHLCIFYLFLVIINLSILPYHKYVFCLVSCSNLLHIYSQPSVRIFCQIVLLKNDVIIIYVLFNMFAFKCNKKNLKKKTHTESIVPQV